MCALINADDLGAHWPMRILFFAGLQIIVKYFDTKANPKGEKATEKNCYANPKNFHICVCTALACFMCVWDEKFTNKQDTLFGNKTSKKCSASHSYCRSLHDLFKEMGDMIFQWVRPGHASDHGIRKGAAVECTSGTTAPPPTSAVAHRGEWSMGKVLDIYWLFAAAGDHYCGRILAGLDVNSNSFDVLPPHFIEGYENEMICNSIKSNYPFIFKLSEDCN